MSTEKEQNIGKRVLKLIDGDIVLGDAFAINTEGGGTDILIKHPYTTKRGNLMPYMLEEMSSAPSAVQIHPMNVMWSVPLDEFKIANEAYQKAEETRIKAETGLEFDDSPKIII